MGHAMRTEEQTKTSKSNQDILIKPNGIKIELRSKIVKYQFSVHNSTEL